MFDIHTSEEKLEIASVERVWKYDLRSAESAEKLTEEKQKGA